MNVIINQPKLGVDITPPEAGISTGTPVARDVIQVDDAVWSEGETITENPTISVDYSTGEISAAYDVTTNHNPIAVSGYAEKEGIFPVRMKGNTSTQLYTIPETIYIPAGADMVIPAERYLTGDQIIRAVAPPYYDMDGAMSFLGGGAELVSSFYSKSDKLKNTDFNGWTPSTTAKAIVASANASTYSADLGNYEYFIVWECGCDMAYTGTPTLKAHFLLSRAYLVQGLFKRPSTWANIEADNFNGNTCGSIYTSNFLQYYGTTTGSVTYTWSQSYGVYFGVTAATFASSTADSTTVTLKTPTVNARCSTTYMSTGNAALVDQDNSTFYIRGKLYRTKTNTMWRGIYGKVVDLVNE